MTQVILDSTNHEHHSYLHEWNHASQRHNALRQWRIDNPPPQGNPSEMPAWEELLQAKSKELDLCTLDRPYEDVDKGIIRLVRATGTFVMKVWRPIRDHTDRIVLGPWIHMCPECGQLYATDDHHELFCSAACREKHNRARLDAKAEHRRKVNTERSTKLASRTGVCLACGDEFTMRRITAKTCSETCRKRLQRKPELSSEFLFELPIRPDLEQLEAEDRKLGQARLDLSWAEFSGRLTEEEQAQLKQMNQLLDERRPILRQQRLSQRLNLIGQHAPALGAWLLTQPVEVQERALSWQYDAVTVLGAALMRKLRTVESF